MAKRTKSMGVSKFTPKAKKNNKGVHSKNNFSKCKNSKNYKKLSVGQG
jgi:hypothetical protein